MDKLEDIWLYINKHGKLIEEPACIPRKSSKWSFAIPACDRDKYIFIQEVAREPGMIFKNAVWFKKQNRSRAKHIFVLGLILSGLLSLCILFEICTAFRPLFSIIFLGGIIALFVAVFLAGILLTPFFLIGFLINLVIFLPVALIRGDKDDK